MNYVLIDLENTQPEHLSVLAGQNFRVLVFVGQNQSKISFDLVSAIQHLGKNAEYIKIQGNGPNALDFHIAFYIGQFSTENSDSHFHIISKDKGFDPLIKHLESKKIPGTPASGYQRHTTYKALQKRKKSLLTFQNLRVQ